MRILHVIPSLDPAYGGPVDLARALCLQLADRGVDSTIFASNLTVNGAVRDIIADEFIEKPFGREICCSVDEKKTLFSRRMWSKLRKTVPQHDLVHLHGFYRFPMSAAGHLAVRHRIPVVVMPHGSFSPYIFDRPRGRRVKRLWEMLFDRRVVRNSASLHFTAEGERRKAASALEKLGLLDVPSFVIHNGIDVSKTSIRTEDGEIRRRLNLGDVDFVVSVGRLAPQKGFDNLIRAFARFRKGHPRIRLVIAGPDQNNFKKELERVAAEEGVSDSVDFPDRLEKKDLYGLLAASTFFAHCSNEENFGIAVVEALAVGTPSVISDQVDIWPELKENGAALVSERDPLKFAEQMTALYADETLQQKLRVNGPLVAQRLFSIDEMARRVYAKYEDLIQQSPKEERVG